MTRFYDHNTDVPAEDCRWPDFSPAEMACRGTGKLKLHPEARDKLQALRDRLGKPLIVRSAYRSPEHNRAVGGATRSKHLGGAAFDIAMSNHNPLSIRFNQGAFSTQRRSALTSALAVSRSLRMSATMATLAGFPAARSAVYLPLRSGLKRKATSAGM